MFTLNCRGRLLVVDKPIVMGIINTTPDSFYEGSRFTASDEVLRQAEKMINAGAAILDIGGQSTRPGSQSVSEDEELGRVLPVIETIHLHFPDSIISVDTYYSRVASTAVQAGASIINDVSGGSIDAGMMAAAGSLRVPFICTHMKGVPGNMQEFASYDNILLDLLDYFIKKKEASRQAGITDLVIDPGFGFSKNISQNFEILRNLRIFGMLDAPLMLGLSRKSTIYRTLGTTAGNALNGSTVLHTIALLNGAHILRVHDVQEAMEAIRLVSAYHGT